MNIYDHCEKICILHELVSEIYFVHVTDDVLTFSIIDAINCLLYRKASKSSKHIWFTDDIDNFKLYLHWCSIIVFFQLLVSICVIYYNTLKSNAFFVYDNTGREIIRRNI